MRSSFAALALVVLALTGCGSPCEDLADRICACQPAGGSVDSCKATVKNQLGSGAQRPGDADQDFCHSKLATCPDPTKTPGQCDVLQTAAGKVACGLAYPASGT